MFSQPRDLTPRSTSAFYNMFDSVDLHLYQSGKQYAQSSKQCWKKREWIAWKDDGFQGSVIDERNSGNSGHSGINFLAKIDADERDTMPTFLDTVLLPSVSTMLEEDSAKVPVTREKWESTKDSFLLDVEAHR